MMLSMGERREEVEARERVELDLGGWRERWRRGGDGDGEMEGKSGGLAIKEGEEEHLLREGRSEEEPRNPRLGRVGVAWGGSWGGGGGC